MNAKAVWRHSGDGVQLVCVCSTTSSERQPLQRCSLQSRRYWWYFDFCFKDLTFLTQILWQQSDLWHKAVSQVSNIFYTRRTDALLRPSDTFYIPWEEYFSNPSQKIFLHWEFPCCHSYFHVVQLKACSAVTSFLYSFNSLILFNKDIFFFFCFHLFSLVDVSYANGLLTTDICWLNNSKISKLL